VEVTVVTIVIGFMPEQHQPGFLGSVPSHSARAAQQIDF
jgi:hypothetical protein